MTSITLPVSQEARNKASEAVRQGAPGVGNGNTVIANEIKGGLHDEYFIVQAFAKFETQIRNAILDEAAGVADKAADRARNHDLYPAHCLNAHASSAETIAASIRQLGERGRG